MELRLLQEREAEQIYHTYMERDFPPSELKPFSSVQGLLRRGLYEPLALYEDGALAAYYAPRKQTLIIECEHPAFAPDPAVAKRRVGFYLRAGARATAMESLLFGVRYQIYALPCGGVEPDTDIRADLETLYRVMVPEPYYRGNVIFFGG